MCHMPHYCDLSADSRSMTKLYVWLSKYKVLAVEKQNKTNTLLIPLVLLIPVLEYSYQFNIVPSPISFRDLPLFTSTKWLPKKSPLPQRLLRCCQLEQKRYYKVTFWWSKHFHVYTNILSSQINLRSITIVSTVTQSHKLQVYIAFINRNWVWEISQ